MEKEPVDTREFLSDDGLPLRVNHFSSGGTPNGLAFYMGATGPLGPAGDPSGPFLGTPYGNALNAAHAAPLATILRSHQIALTVFGKRGSLPSHGKWANEWATFSENLGDFLGVIEDELPRHSRRLPIFLIGFSEGALIAAAAAAHLQERHSERSIGLFLLSPSLRPFDQLIRYQFVTWPISQGLKNGIDAKLELEQIEQLVATPMFTAWYSSAKIERWSTLCSSIKCPAYIYQGQLDSQVDSNWVSEDARNLGSLREVRIYRDYGHGLAPYNGSFASKSSGPIQDDVLRDLSLDVGAVLLEFSRN